MTFALPGALALLVALLLVALLALLQTRQRSRDVATYFLWRQLSDSISNRTQRLLALLDPLLLLQMVAIAIAALAIAQPFFAYRQSGFANLAIVLDSSASMSTRMDSGLTRFEAAQRRADEILAAYRSSSVSILLLSSTPRALVAGETDIAHARKALAGAAPGWEGDGGSADLVRGLESLGGGAAFEQIVVLSDHAFPDPPFPMRSETFNEGENLGIVSFSVRENAAGGGVSAFVELSSDAEDARQVRLAISDEANRTTIDAFLESGERSAYVVPFPASRGTRFTASIAADDAFAADDVRYASLRRGAKLHVRWLGRDNRYLSAALEAVAPVVRVSDGPADLTVVYDRTLDALPEGNVLLVHASVPGAISVSGVAPGGVVSAGDDDPLLDGLRPSDIYADSVEDADVVLPHRDLLRVGDSAFLARILDPARLVLILSSDLTATNFPITVDFPLLIRNVVAATMPSSAAPASRWALVGQGVALPGLTDAVLDPRGRPVPLVSGQGMFFPELPGQYTMLAGDVTTTVSVNVDPAETTLGGQAAVETAATALPPLSSQLQTRAWAAWPLLAGLLFAALVAELIVFERRRESQRSAR